MLFIISFDLYNTLQTGITRAMVLQFIHPSCCETKLFVRKPYTHIHWSQIQSLWRTKLCFHPGSAWWSNEFYRGCLLGQKWLTDSCIPKFTPAWVTGRKSWEPRVYTHSMGSLRDWRMFSSRDSDLSFFQAALTVWSLQAAGLISESTLQLGLSQSLLGLSTS